MPQATRTLTDVPTSRPAILRQRKRRTATSVMAGCFDQSMRRIIPIAAFLHSNGAKQAVSGNIENEDAVMSHGESGESPSRPSTSLTHTRAHSGPADMLTSRSKASGFLGGRSSHISTDNTLPAPLTTDITRTKKPRTSYAEKYTASVSEPVLPGIEVSEESQPPAKKNNTRKRVTTRKGWKGWVEADVTPQRLILLDKPEVLPERTTRSGRRID